ncbi:MAG: hypothetical protein Q7S33_00140 [Nanoarchaeota archaeon]|nr:hypothetical protein [Nanoarchaeota archaeon]
MQDEKDIRYYQQRLEIIEDIFVTSLHDSEERKALDNNHNIVRKVLEGYNQFKNHPDYDSVLPGTIETFVLGE